MAVQSRITLEEFLRLDETEPASEYACGEVYQKPMPNRPHAGIQGFLIAMLFPFLERTKLGEVFPELRCIFGPPGKTRAYVPDLVYVTRERLTDDFYLRTAPDLAVEILSPDQHMVQFMAKIQFYLLHGVRLVWIIDPARGTVAVMAPGEDVRTLAAGETLDGGDVLPGFSVEVADIFSGPRSQPQH
jgi:Uma2 family endonuclease